MKEILVVHYSELGTKGGNRRSFELKLAEDIRRRLGPSARVVRVEDARIVAELSEGASRDHVAAAMGSVFGVAWFGFGTLIPWSASDDALGPVEQAALRCAQETPPVRTFKIEARRSAKRYPLSSQELCVRLGAAVAQQTGLAVDVHSPDRRIGIEVLERNILVVSHRREGLRGLPQFSSGRLLCLFSGGIDSPVAAWQMMRRGARVDLLHFHPYRSSQEVVGTKITQLFDVLRAFNPTLKLVLVPHDRYQVSASMNVPTACETVFFRRFMFRAGERWAHAHRYQGLITGDSLGQVASQTLTNLQAVQTGLSVPIFQPLIAMDKDTIIVQSRTIGAYEPSLLAYKDCCSLLTKKPKTSVDPGLIRRLEAELDMDRIVTESLGAASLWDGHSLS